MTRLGSNADIFSRRGNPWISEKDQDGTRLHRREPMTDREVKLAKITGKTALTPIITHPVDPDMDRWTKASFRDERVEHGPDTPIKPKPADVPQAQQIANIARSFRRKTNARVVSVGESKSVLAMKAAAYLRQQAEAEIRVQRVVSGYSVYVRHADGTEEERDRPTRAMADTLFARMRQRRTVAEVEMWSYVTGEMLASFTRKSLTK